VPSQIVDPFRPLLSVQIVRAADHGQRERRRQTHCDHIGLDELAEPDACVKSSGSDICSCSTSSAVVLDFITESCSN
jgi:hypothetical protein